MAAIRSADAALPEAYDSGRYTDRQVQTAIKIARARLRKAAVILTMIRERQSEAAVGSALSRWSKIDAYRYLEAAETAVVAARVGLGEQEA